MNSLNIKDLGQLNVLEVAMDHMEEHLYELSLDPEYAYDPVQRRWRSARFDNVIKLQGALAQLRNQMLSAMEE